jgi:hypothetical protein
MGSDPSITGPWHNVGDSGEPSFQNGWGNSGGSLAPMRFRLVVGPPDAVIYTRSIEIQGSVTGGSSGAAIFTLPAEYAPDADLHLTACDDSGAFLVLTVQANGNVIAGFV